LSKIVVFRTAEPLHSRWNVNLKKRPNNKKPGVERRAKPSTGIPGRVRTMLD
jgi:hypothetical protein